VKSENSGFLFFIEGHFDEGVDDEDAGEDENPIKVPG
jgi:hypothetical protein